MMCRWWPYQMMNILKLDHNEFVSSDQRQYRGNAPTVGIEVILLTSSNNCANWEARCEFSTIWSEMQVFLYASMKMTCFSWRVCPWVFSFNCLQMISRFLLCFCKFASRPVPNTIRRPRGHSGNCGIFLYFQGPTQRSNPWWIPSRCFGSSSPKTPKIRVAGWSSISAKWPPTASWTFVLAHIFDLPSLDAIVRLVASTDSLLEHWIQVDCLKLALVWMEVEWITIVRWT